MPPGVEALTAELADQARTLLGEATYNYFAGGSGTEVSLGEARAGWLRYRLRPRVLVDVETVHTDTSLLGAPLPSPVAIAPVAFLGQLHESAEVGVVRGAGAHLTIISTRASCGLEDVAAAAGGPWWFQVYLTADRRLTEAMVCRAVAAGARALVLTGDTPYIGRKARAGRLAQLDDPATLTNFAPHLGPAADPRRDTEQSPAVTTADIAWLAQLSGLPVLVKGVLRGDDARRCLDAGASGVIVSNHGGRQLDRAISTALALPEVVAACDTAPVLVDGGIRSAVDVLVALGLGARAVLLGRPVAWALACEGAAGVAQLLDGFDDELTHVMALAGCPDLRAIDASLVREPR